MKKRLTAERRNEIAQLLLRDGNIKASSLAEHFEVSTETIRKDLIYLEEQGIAQKSYGGAVVCNELLERPVALKEMEHMDIKTAIATQALSLIPENGIILLDAGSTTYALAKLLMLRRDLTIFTNSLMILNLLSESDNELYAIGGRVRGSSKGLVGAWSVQAIRSLHIDAAFLGCDGFRDTTGPTTAAYDEYEFKQAVLASSNRTVILTDNTKFSSNSLFQFCRWKDIYALVTNNSDTPEFQSLSANIQKETQILLA